MTSTSDLVLRAARHLADEYAVDVNLDETLMRLPPEPAQAAEAIEKLLDERVRALKDAATTLSQLRGEIASLAETLPYTDSGWSERKQGLEQRLAANLRGGLLAWLDDWATATARGLDDALERLATDVALPPAGRLLRDRCAFSLVGLQRAEWGLAQAALWVLAEGIEHGAETLPSRAVRGGLWLLIARLALRTGHLEEAGTALDHGAKLAPNASVEALRARLLRLRGDLDGAQGRLDAARTEDPVNFDVAAELITQAEGERQSQMALEVARLTIDALPHIADCERELRPLFGEAPAAIWLATAERALREGDLGRCEWAAEMSARYSEPAQTLASIAELRVRASEIRDAPSAEQAAALTELGKRWVWAGEPALAIEPLEQARKLDSDNEQSLLFLANALTGRVELEPLARSSADAEQALELIAGARRRQGNSLREPWGYIVESGAHLRLASGIGPAAETHAWLGLESACRGVARTGDLPLFWEQLSAAASGLRLNQVAEMAARKAFDLSPEHPRIRAVLATALLVNGHPTEAIEYISGYEPVFEAVFKAFAAIRNEQAEEAVRLLRQLEAPPPLPWVTDILIDALLLGLGVPEALEEAASARSQLKPRLDEVDARLLAARIEMLLGDLDLAEELLMPLLDGRSHSDAYSLLGRLQLLRSEGETGIENLAMAIGRASPTGLNDWKLVVEPELRILAERAAVELPDLQPVDAAVVARRAELERTEDVVAELTAAPTGLAAERSAEEARWFCIGLLELLKERPNEARNALERLASAAEDADVAHLAALASAAAEKSGNESDPGQPGFVHMLHVILPPSWFADSDEATEHPLLVRYIPEMRLRAGWGVPGVYVSVEEELEPDRYRIEVHGEAAAEGSVDPSCFYLPVDVEPAVDLAMDGGAALEIRGLPSLQPFAAKTGAGLEDLLAFSSSEVVARHLGAIVEEHAEALGRP